MAEIPDPTRYVIGFCFNEAGTMAVLIEKDHPDWQAGKLNGVGGKVDGAESLTQAMAREFAEETGVETKPGQWQALISLEGPAYACTVLRMFNEDAYLAARTVTSEPIRSYPVDHLPDNVVTPLGWLVPLAADRRVAPGVRVWRVSDA